MSCLLNVAGEADQFEAVLAGDFGFVGGDRLIRGSAAVVVLVVNFDFAFRAASRDD
jgi:hypothetical protein